MERKRIIHPRNVIFDESSFNGQSKSIVLSPNEIPASENRKKQKGQEEV